MTHDLYQVAIQLMVLDHFGYFFLGGGLFWKTILNKENHEFFLYERPIHTLSRQLGLEPTTSHVLGFIAANPATFIHSTNTLVTNR